MQGNKLKPVKGVSRIDSNRTHCWYVRVGYKNRKPRFVKSFPDKKYGGKQQSLEAANDYAMRRRGLLRKNNLLHDKYQPIGMNSRNTSGYPGVSFKKPNKKNKEAWQVSWRVHGKPQHTSFSIAKWGSMALPLAVLSYRLQRRATVSDLDTMKELL